MNEQFLNDVITLRHELHKRAELSLHEERTKAYLMQWLEERNKNNKMEIVDEGTWFYVYIKSEGDALMPPVAFRGDMDALPIPDIDTLPYASETPGVSHRCGHDGHSANLAGACILISEMNLNRDVYLVFQHAEEIGAGGEPCSKLMEEKEISSVYAFHNWSGYPQDTIMVKTGITHCASEGVTFTFTGKTSHASQPEDGRNPSVAISKLILLAKELETSDIFTDRVMATVVNVEIGSKNFGINAGDGSVSMTLRGFKEDEMILLEKKLSEEAEKLSKEEELALQIELFDVFPETVNDEASTSKVIEAASALNIPWEIMADPIRSSEDFGYFQKKTKGAMFYIGNGIDYPAVHTIPYDYRDENFKTTLQMFCKLAEIG